MSSNAIGHGAVIISANADPMANGLEKAKGDLKKWAKEAPKEISGKNFLGNILGAGSAAGGALLAGGGTLSGLGGGIGMAIGGPVGAGIGAAIGGGLGNLAGHFGEITEAADNASKSARSLGTSTESLMGLQ